MDVEILPNYLDWLHRIGNPKTKKKERPIIVKFVRYNLRHNTFNPLLKMLKNGQTLCNKGLRRKKCFDYRKSHKRSYGKLNEPRDTYGFRNAWTSDGKIFFKDEENPSSKPLIYYD